MTYFPTLCKMFVIMSESECYMVSAIVFAFLWGTGYLHPISTSRPIYKNTFLTSELIRSFQKCNLNDENIINNNLIIRCYNWRPWVSTTCFTSTSWTRRRWSRSSWRWSSCTRSPRSTPRDCSRDWDGGYVLTSNNQLIFLDLTIV